VAYPHLSLAGGAIRSWDRKNAYYFALITAMARHYKFDPETPWEDLSKKAQQVMLYGSGNDEVEFRYVHGNGRTTKKKHRFEGIIPNLERRYKETDSLPVREELAKYLGSQPCPDCHGTRLNRTARNVFVGSHSLPEIAHLTVGDAKALFGSLDVAGWRAEVADKIVKEVGDRLKFLVDVGLDYLTLDRSAESLSGGEAQRIRLASQVGSGLTGVMYILDEPSIGLHQRDNQRLLGTLKHLRDLGNTVLVVEHDEEAIRAADDVLDIGPGAGVHGGEVVAHGTPGDILKHPASLTGQYLSGRRKIALPTLRTPRDPKRVIEVVNARGNNLKKVTACRVPASPRWSTTRCSRTPTTSSTAPSWTWRPATRCAGSRPSTASSTSTRVPSAARRVPTRPPTPACSAHCANCSPRCPRRARVATTPAVSAST
jgi:excinuclease ABC subunit A